MKYFPFMMNLEGQAGLVLGGGRVAWHKIKVLLPFGARLMVVSEAFCADLLSLWEKDKKQLELYKGSFTEKLLERDGKQIAFVVAATDDEALQEEVSNCCRSRGIPVNVVDVKEKSTFFFPALFSWEDLVVAVSTGGQVPVAAGYVKEQIRKSLPPYYGEMIRTLGAEREKVKKTGISYEERKQFFLELLRYGEEHEGQIPQEIIQKKLEEKIRKYTH